MYKKVMAILFGIAIFLSNINANALINVREEFNNDNNYLIETYRVSKEAEDEFLKCIDKIKYNFMKKYEYVDYNKQVLEDEVTEEISKEIEYKNVTYNGNLYMTNIPNSIHYNENGYSGDLLLDRSNVKLNKNNEFGIDNYNYIAVYKAKLTKKVEPPYIYEIRYVEVIDYIFVPVVITGAMLICIIYIFRKNVKIYNLQFGKWILIKKIRLRKSLIDISKIKHKSISDKYKIEISKSLNRKLYNKKITIQKDKSLIDKIIDKIEKKYEFEVYFKEE